MRDSLIASSSLPVTIRTAIPFTTSSDNSGKVCWFHVGFTCLFIMRYIFSQHKKVYFPYVSLNRCHPSGCAQFIKEYQRTEVTAKWQWCCSH